MKLLHGYLDRGHGHGSHAICTDDGNPLEMTAENVERLINLWNNADVTKEELVERNHLLANIALSAVALKLNIDHGFNPSLHAINRDLSAFSRRFGGIIRDGHEEQPGS